MSKRCFFCYLCLCITLLPLSGCAVIDVAGKGAEALGKIAGAAIEVTGKVIITSGKVAGALISLPGGKASVRLIKEGNSLFVKALINRKVWAKMLLDTGCEDTQLSVEIVNKLKIPARNAETVVCRLADGRAVEGKAVNIKEMRVGKMRAYNIRAIVLSQAKISGYDGLLGMSFLNNFSFEIDADRNRLILKHKKEPKR